MRTPVSQPDLRQQFGEALAGARRRIHHSVLRARLLVALEQALWAVLALAGAYALLRGVCLLVGRRALLGWTAFAGLLAVAVVLLIVVTMIRAWKAVPTQAEAAERLDLSTANHNRVATALCLLARGDRAPFSSAAIRDGLRHLQRLQERTPHLDSVHLRRRRAASLALASVLVVLAAWICPSALDTTGATHGRLFAAGTPTHERRPTQTSSEEAPEPEATAPRRQTRAAQPGGRPRQAATEPAPPSGSPRTEAAGQEPGGGAGAPAGAAEQAAGTRGDSTAATASSPRRDTKDQHPPGERRPHSARVADAGKPDSPQDSSSISRGASGGGAMSAVHHSWSQRAQATEGDTEDEESEEEVEDESESSRQRGGLQPSLKDRNESPARELGISGEEGPPGTGRGGPTPPKKSRGTASLVLGIPIPDFVKGRTGPGTTKVTHERVEPVPMLGDSTAVVEVAARTLPENPTPRFEVPRSYAAIVRDYLVALHSADRKAEESSAPSADPADP